MIATQRCRGAVTPRSRVPVAALPRRRSGRSLLVLLAGVGLMLLASPSAMALPAPHRCRGSFDTSGRYYRTVNFWNRFSERGTNCGRALGVARQYIIDTGIEGGRDQIGRWSCVLHMRTFHNADHTPYGVVECSARGGRRIRFYGIS